MQAGKNRRIGLMITPEPAPSLEQGQESGKFQISRYEGLLS
jgi:hypothetical protein